MTMAGYEGRTDVVRLTRRIERMGFTPARYLDQLTPARWSAGFVVSRHGTRPGVLEIRVFAKSHREDDRESAKVTTASIASHLTLAGFRVHTDQSRAPHQAIVTIPNHVWPGPDAMALILLALAFVPAGVYWVTMAKGAALAVLILFAAAIRFVCRAEQDRRLWS
jgi:hypothetical protein